MDLRKTISVNEFWQYSVQFYSQNNNQSTLLWLQDNAGLNVNIILLLLYLQTKNVFISPNEFSYLIKKIKNLDSLASNFREKRRALKAFNQAKGMVDFRTSDYQSLLQQELDIEKQQQALLLTEIFELPKRNKNKVVVKKHVIIDIKAYLTTLTNDQATFVASKCENYLEELILEQMEMAFTFGLDNDE